MEEAQGTCQDAMNAQCVSALVARAEKVDVTGLGSEEACAKLESAFKETVDDVCTVFADGNTWTGVSVKREQSHLLGSGNTILTSDRTYRLRCSCSYHFFAKELFQLLAYRSSRV